MPGTYSGDSLFVTAIDHRIDLVRTLIGTPGEAPSAADLERAAHLQGIVFAGLAEAVETGLPKSNTAVWAEPELGEAVLLRGRAMSMPTVASVERPESTQFQLRNPLGFSERLSKLGATYAGARIRHIPDGGILEQHSHLQSLRRLSEVSRSEGPPFICELTVSFAGNQSRDARGIAASESEGRAAALLQSLAELQDAGVDPAIWAFEAPADPIATAALAARAHIDDRNETRVLLVACADHESSADDPTHAKVATLAARTPGVDGLLIGPAAYYAALAGYHRGEIDREEAAGRIAATVGALAGKFARARSTSDVS